MIPTDKLAAVLWEADRHLDTIEPGKVVTFGRHE
jgi:hypothetical protein